MNIEDQPFVSGATILSFSRRRRGRPKSMRKGVDTGTPELAIKRQIGETAETLDLCLKRGLITEEQHWCGIHLRWLYTLRYGAPGIRAIDPTHARGMEVKPDDPQWRAQREREYHEAIRTLGGHALLLMNVCVYNERPAFLNAALYEKEASPALIGRLCMGLDILCGLWGRSRAGI